MDWFTLLLVFIFFVLPLIQQIAEARKRGQQPPEPELDEEEWIFEEERGGRASPPAPPAEAVPVTRGEASDGWSSGWGSWPGEAQPEPEEMVVLDAEPRVVAIPERRAEPRPVPPPPPVRAERPAPVTRPERVLVERPVPLEPVVVERAREPRPRARPREMSVPVYGARRSATALGTAVHDPAELRRAILLSEVLGPPRSLRPLESERD